MSRKMSSFSLSAVVLLLFIFPEFSDVQAQVNLKAGYNFSMMSDPGLNQVISTFTENQSYDRGFKKVSWLHGLEAGIRFKADIHAFELTYQSAYQALSANGTLQPESVTYTDKINMSVNSISGGYQLAGDFVGGGLDLQYQRYNARVRLEGQDEFRNTQEMWGLKFYMMLTLEGSGNIDAAVQPYVVVPFGLYETDPLSLYLNQEPGPEGKKWMRVGFTLVFYNGGK